MVVAFVVNTSEKEGEDIGVTVSVYRSTGFASAKEGDQCMEYCSSILSSLFKSIFMGRSGGSGLEFTS